HLASQWHPNKNGNFTPREVVAGSGTSVWWRCAAGHEWRARVAHRAKGVGCPFCNCGWTIENIRVFVGTLKEHLHSFAPAGLYLLFQQNGLLASTGKGKAFVKALATGRFPKEEVEKFVRGQPSLA